MIQHDDSPVTLPRRPFTHPTVDHAVSVLAGFGGLDLNRDQAARLLRAWVRFPTLLPAEVEAILRCFPVGASPVGAR